MPDNNEPINISLLPATTEADLSANFRVYTKKGLIVQITDRADTPEKLAKVMIFLEGLDFIVDKLEEMGYSTNDPRMMAAEARQQLTANGADPALKEDEQEAQFYMVVEQANKQRMICFYNIHPERNVTVGKIYPEKFGTLPWALDITTV